MKATPEDVAKRNQFCTHPAEVGPASMKATPEDVAKDGCMSGRSLSSQRLNEGHARRRGEDAQPSDCPLHLTDRLNEGHARRRGEA